MTFDKHILTEEEFREFIFIRDCLSSSDSEVVKLGMSLLKKYPENIYTKYGNLGNLLIHLLEWTHTYEIFYLFRLRLSVFINKVIHDKYYYTQRNESAEPNIRND